MQTEIDRTKIVSLSAFRREALRAGRKRAAPPVIVEACGWYHDEAMRAETTVTTLPPRSSPN